MSLDIGIEHFLFVEDLELLVYISAIISIAVFLYGVYRRVVKWFGRIPSISDIKSLDIDISTFLRESLTQVKVLRKPGVGSAHALVFYGFIILFIGTILRALEYDIGIRIFRSRFLVGDVYLIFKFFMNVGGLIAIIGLILLLIRRVGFKSTYLPDTINDYLLLILLIVILVTGFLLDSISTATYRLGWIGYSDFIGVSLIKILDGFISQPETIYRGLWVFHMFIALASAALIPYTKLGHMVFGGIFNYIFRRRYPASKLRGIEDLDKMVEEKGYIGALSVKDLTWKERMDLDACIKCSRCTDVCPATESGKPLSPMHLILDLKGLMDRDMFDVEVAPEKIESDVFWSCLTCGACVNVCPMYIHHVETIVDFRRGLVSKGEDVPEDVLNLSYNLMRYSNPLGYDPMEGAKLIEELSRETGVEIAGEDVEYDYIFWIGCQTIFEPNNREIAKAFLKLVKKAGVNIALLPEVVCCGEPAKRIGDEMMYRELVSMNAEVFKRIRFKKLVVNCPHGYNTFKNEYKDYGVELDVIHHTQLLRMLLEEGRIRVKNNGLDVTYHDPCYLGRWNREFESPRKLIKAVVGDKLREMERSRENSFCCGAGGGHMFFEIKRGERVSKIRYAEAVKTGAKVLCTACPFCKTMFDSESKGELKIMDISEFLLDNLED